MWEIARLFITTSHGAIWSDINSYSILGINIQLFFARGSLNLCGLWPTPSLVRTVLHQLFRLDWRVSRNVRMILTLLKCFLKKYIWNGYLLIHLVHRRQIKIITIRIIRSNIGLFLGRCLVHARGSLILAALPVDGRSLRLLLSRSPELPIEFCRVWPHRRWVHLFT